MADVVYLENFLPKKDFAPSINLGAIPSYQEKKVIDCEDDLDIVEQVMDITNALGVLQRQLNDLTGRMIDKFDE